MPLVAGTNSKPPERARTWSPQDLDIILVLAVLIGGVLAWQTGSERSRLTERQRRLAQGHGRPADRETRRRSTSWPWIPGKGCITPGGSISPAITGISCGSIGEPAHGLVEQTGRIHRPGAEREVDQGRLEIYTHFSGGSSRMGFGEKSLADLLRGRWDEVRVEQLGAGDVAVTIPADRRCCSG